MLQAEVDELTTALGEAHVELRVWKKSAEYHWVRLAPDPDLEAICQDAEMPTTRSCVSILVAAERRGRHRANA